MRIAIRHAIRRAHAELTGGSRGDGIGRSAEDGRL